MYRYVIRVALFLILPLAVSAQTNIAAPSPADAQIRRIELALNRLSLEQQSLYQQFQMLQEMRRGEMQHQYDATQSYTPPATPPNYDDIVRERSAREQRIRQYGDELDRLYARYRDLDAQKQPLLDALSQLALAR
jgi:hypothetical protein